MPQAFLRRGITRRRQQAVKTLRCLRSQLHGEPIEEGDAIGPMEPAEIRRQRRSVHLQKPLEKRRGLVLAQFGEALVQSLPMVVGLLLRDDVPSKLAFDL